MKALTWWRKDGAWWCMTRMCEVFVWFNDEGLSGYLEDDLDQKDYDCALEAVWAYREGLS